MKAFVGKNRSWLLTHKGDAVPQLASQEPNDSAVHRAWKAGRAGKGTQKHDSGEKVEKV